MGRSGAEWEFEVRSEGRCAQVGARHLRVPAHLRHRARPVLHLRNQDSDGRPPRVGRAKMLRPGPEPGSQEASARVRGDRPRLGFLEACALSPQGVIGASVALRPQSGGGGSGVVKSLRDPPPGPAGLPPGRARVLLPTMPPWRKPPRPGPPCLSRRPQLPHVASLPHRCARLPGTRTLTVRGFRYPRSKTSKWETPETNNS